MYVSICPGNEIRLDIFNSEEYQMWVKSCFAEKGVEEEQNREEMRSFQRTQRMSHPGITNCQNRTTPSTFSDFLSAQIAQLSTHSIFFPPAGVSYIHFLLIRLRVADKAIHFSFRDS